MSSALALEINKLPNSGYPGAVVVRPCHQSGIGIGRTDHQRVGAFPGHLDEQVAGLRFDRHGHGQFRPGEPPLLLALWRGDQSLEGHRHAVASLLGNRHRRAPVALGRRVNPIRIGLRLVGHVERRAQHHWKIGIKRHIDHREFLELVVQIYEGSALETGVVAPGLDRDDTRGRIRRHLL